MGGLGAAVSVAFGALAPGGTVAGGRFASGHRRLRTSSPRVRVGGGAHGAVSQAGTVLLVETAREAGLDQVISRALMPWRRPRAVHDPGKILLDLALAVAVGGNCLADVGMPRAEPAVFGPVASDPAVSRLIDTLAAAGPKALSAIRAARVEARERVWNLARTAAPDVAGRPRKRWQR